jgi:proteasome-associated ATPase
VATYEEQQRIIQEMVGTIKSQTQVLERLTSTPLALAPVIFVGTTKIPLDSPKAFVKGTLVVVNVGPYKGTHATIERVDKDGEGMPYEVYVKFGDGTKGWYVIRDVTVTESGSTDFAVVIYDGKYVEVIRPPDINVRPGDVVRVSMETMQIVDKATIEPHGEVVSVKRVHGDGLIEVDYQASPRVVFPGSYSEFERGDLVILDSTGSVVLYKLDQDEPRFAFTQNTNVSWEEIGGLADAKRIMREVVEGPVVHADLYAFYNKKPVKGVLLYGPPGCGKTMLGKATATALAKLYGVSNGGFLYVKAPEILSKYIGVAEATIRQIFEHARRFRLEHGYPAVVFIDEADAILGKRGTGISSDIERTIVPTFLTEMDGLDTSGAVVILATNRPDVLDPAIVRDGRIDRKVKIDRPTSESAPEVFGLYLNGMPLSNGYTVQELAEQATASLFDNDRVLYEVVLQGGTTLNFTLGKLCNGAMIAGIVDQATSIAMHRDVVSGREPEGLRPSDLVEAIDQVLAGNHDLNHGGELEEFVYDFRADVVDILKRRVVAA